VDYLRSSTTMQDKAGIRREIRYLDDAVDELLKEGEEKK
jgi:hypothetical protein